MWWSWRNWFLTVSMLEECGGLERTDFLQFLLWEVVVVLKELYFYWFFTVSILRELILQFLLWMGVVVLKELIFYSFYLWELWWSWKNWFLTVSMLEGCGGLEGTDGPFNSFYVGRVWWSWRNWFFTVSMMEECGGLERTHFYIYR